MLTTGDESYIDNTIIDANFNGRVVTFENNETNDAVLMGFTIRNGFAVSLFDLDDGAGIYIDFSSPSLKYLKITNNTAIFGAGISMSSSNSYFERLTIKENNSFRDAGGLMIYRRAPYPENSNPIFNSVNRCSIYNNTAGSTADIYISENHTPITNIYVDTLTVLDPDWNYVSQFPNLELDIQHQWRPQIEADLYVSPDGNDNNSGMSASEPFKTIQWALTRIKADSLNPRNVYLAPGVYSPELNGQQFPLNMRANVSLIGSGMNQSILTDPYFECRLIHAFYDNNYSLKSLTLSNCSSEYLGYVIFAEYSKSIIDSIKVENYDGCSSVAKFSYADSKISNSIFENNKCSSVISFHTNSEYNINLYLNNLIFCGNESSIYSDDSGCTSLSLLNVGYAKISNCLFYNNDAESDYFMRTHIGFTDNGIIDFFNNTIANNSGDGPIVSFGGNDEVNIKNCILYDNSTPWMFSYSNSDEPMYVNLDHSIIEGGTNPAIIHVVSPGEYGAEFTWGEGIIGLEPSFIEGDPEDPLSYQVLYDSPAIDSGTPDTTGLGLPEYDLAGNPRIYGDYIDIGAYEWQGVSTNDELIMKNERIFNYPNPFNPETTISFSLSKSSDVNLSIYNLKGETVRHLLDSWQQTGSYNIIWDGTDDSGKKLSSGLYLCRLTIDGQPQTRKMIFLK